MARPVRHAALRARELISLGLGKKILKAEEEDEDEGMSSGEEEELDDLLVGEDPEEMSSDEEEIPVVRGSKKKASQDDTARISTYHDVDIKPQETEFRPERPPGPHVSVTRGDVRKCFRAIDFFGLFFTTEIMQTIIENTNLYGYLMILEKPTYAAPDGSWEELTTQEFMSYLGLLIIMGLIRIPDISRRWSQATLYSGGWCARFMSRNRYKAISGMLHVEDPSQENPNDRLTKIRPLLDHMKSVCTKLFQPRRSLSVDERMVKSKGRSGIRQYMPNKPARFGFKLWCLCDSSTGYTLDLDIYTGRRHHPTENGLGFDVVASLANRYAGQGYRVFFDNFFTSIKLLRHLQANGLDACGTTLPNRQGFPAVLKDKVWVKKAATGDMRYIRQGAILCQQWRDKKPVCMCSTFHQGHTFVMVDRHRKRPDGSHERVLVKKPTSVHDYNRNMGGVDLSDQLLEPYSVLQKCRRWWKTLFLHLFDVAILNAYLLFKECQLAYPDVPGLRRPSDYSHLAFREELARQLGRISDDEQSPTSAPRPRRKSYFAMDNAHIPQHQKERRNCKVCYLLQGKQLRSHWICTDQACNVHLCNNADRNCFALWHTDAFQRLRHDMLK